MSNAPFADQNVGDQTYSGSFRVQRDRDAWVLTHESGSPRLMLTGVKSGELPASLSGFSVRRTGHGSDRSRRFELSERGRHWEVQARSLQVHETVDLYGRAIALPRYALRQRLLWSLLLGLARFEWGQALIRRLTGRRPDR